MRELLHPWLLQMVLQMVLLLLLLTMISQQLPQLQRPVPLLPLELQAAAALILLQPQRQPCQSVGQQGC